MNDKDDNDYEVIDTWKNKVVYKGKKELCLNYIRGNNVYQMNYSKLKLNKINNNGNNSKD